MTVQNSGAILVVGGYGVVGAQIVRLLRKRNAEVPLWLGGRNPEKGKALAEELGNATPVHLDAEATDPLGELSAPPELVLTAVNDPGDRVLLAAVRAGIPIVD
ncbi:MAG: saccharopine dehydrogenase, partial [bacterium]|nr:saccharopine dehydrogenase [bacterium]